MVTTLATILGYIVMSGFACSVATYIVCRWWIARRERKQAEAEQRRVARIQLAAAHNAERRVRMHQMGRDVSEGLRTGRPVVIDLDE
jgi:hypothetical protein